MGNNLTFRFMFATTLIILVVMSVNFIWEYEQQRRQAFTEMREKAAVITKQLIATREFIAKNQNKINYDSRGNFEFKHLNPAAVGMGTSKIFEELTDYQIKQTRIFFRAQENAPDYFETLVLDKFKENPELREFWAEDEINGKRVFRYMIPLKIEKSCLPCHGEPVGEYDIAGYRKEGYKEGSLGGAISLIMPMDIFISNLQSNALRYAGFFLFLTGVILVAMYFLVTRLVVSSLGDLEKAVGQIGKGKLNIDLSNIKAKGEIKQLANHFQHMTNQLRDLYNNLELKVEQRTIQLGKTNKELQEANKKLQEVNRYKSDFLAIMSHELRTPLTSIIAFTELLLEVIPESNATERNNLVEIKKNSNSLLELINNLLDLAKIEAGRSELRLETMDMTDVICSVEGIISPLAKKKGIQFTTKISQEVPLIKADPEKIRRVVENLAGNAIKFTDKGGKVEITVDFDKVKQKVLLVVSDTGIGIKKDDLKTIFDRFTQSDSSDSRKYGGTGLGLALAKELVDLHGGSIEVSSEITKGSIFKVILPINPKKDEV